MPAPAQPLLTLGSFGEAVRKVQQALNLAPSKLAKLAEDAAFGPKTFARTKEFQSDAGIKSDGWVGPQTYAELEYYFKLTEAFANGVTILPPDADELATRNRIVKAAEMFLATYGGWTSPMTDDDLNPTSPWIAAGRGVGPIFNLPNNSPLKRRPRQGGVGLSLIFQLAAVPSMNCLMISDAAEKLYRGSMTAAVRVTLNRTDIPSWCGIFAVACYRTAGLNLNWNDRLMWAEDGKLPKRFENLGAAHGKKIYAGDIGAFNPGNHHFVVVKDSEPGEDIHSIDGNVAQPNQADGKIPFFSIIARRCHTRKDFGDGNGQLLRPIFQTLQKPT